MFEDMAAAIVDARVVDARRVAGGLSWPECPRWRDGVVWFTDMYTGTLRTIDDSGNVRVVVDTAARAARTAVPVVLGGFGWLPDGRLIVVSMYERLLLVSGGSDELSVYADLGELAPFPINDMVVAADGHAYITQLGFDFFHGATPTPSPIIVVDPTGRAGTADAVAPLLAANGIAISADGRSLYTAEAFANRIAVMDLGADGTLSNSRVFAETPSLPDGIALDAQGGVWAAMPGTGYVARFVEGGAVTDVVAVPVEDGLGSACLLSGPDRTTLYITVGAEVADFAKSAREAAGSIWIADVDFSGGSSRP